MWLNKDKVSDDSIQAYRHSLLHTRPNYIVIDGLFDDKKLDDVMDVLRTPHHWQTQKHTYSALYVDDNEWNNSDSEERFVKRDIWRRETNKSKFLNPQDNPFNVAHEFLSFLRSDEFLSVLSRIFNATLTDESVGDPELNTNYFRLNSTDFVEQHADDSPGREVCMLLYLNKGWKTDAGGELVFLCDDKEPIAISPLYNRCVLFDPSSEGSEHLVKRLNSQLENAFRYNVTSWYWSE